MLKIVLADPTTISGYKNIDTAFVFDTICIALCKMYNVRNYGNLDPDNCTIERIKLEEFKQIQKIYSFDENGNETIYCDPRGYLAPHNNNLDKDTLCDILDSLRFNGLNQVEKSSLKNILLTEVCNYLRGKPIYSSLCTAIHSRLSEAENHSVFKVLTYDEITEKEKETSNIILPIFLAVISNLLDLSRNSKSFKKEVEKAVKLNPNISYIIRADQIVRRIDEKNVLTKYPNIKFIVYPSKIYRCATDAEDLKKYVKYFAGCVNNWMIPIEYANSLKKSVDIVKDATEEAIIFNAMPTDELLNEIKNNMVKR